MFWEGGGQGIIRVEFGRDQWAGVKGIAEGGVLGSLLEFQVI